MTSNQTKEITRITASYILARYLSTVEDRTRGAIYRQLMSDNDYFDLKLAEFSARCQVKDEE